MNRGLPVLSSVILTLGLSFGGLAQANPPQERKSVPELVQIIRRQPDSPQAAQALESLSKRYRGEQRNRLLRYLARRHARSIQGLRARLELLHNTTIPAQKFLQEVDQLLVSAGSRPLRILLNEGHYLPPSKVAWLSERDQQTFLQSLPSGLCGALYAQGQIQLARRYQNYALRSGFKDVPSHSHSYSYSYSHGWSSRTDEVPHIEILFPTVAEQVGEDEDILLEISGNANTKIAQLYFDQQALNVPESAETIFEWASASRAPCRQRYWIRLPKQVRLGPHRLLVKTSFDYQCPATCAFPLVVVRRLPGKELEGRFQDCSDQQCLTWFKEEPGRCFLQQYDGREWQDTLSLAIASKHWQAACYLVEQGVRATPECGETAYRSAFYGGPFELCKALFEHDCRPSDACKATARRREFDPRLLQLCLQAGLQMELADIIFLVSTGEFEVIQSLPKYHHDLTRGDDSGKSLLHYCKDPKLAKFLVEQGCDPKQRDKLGNNPLQSLGGEKCSKELQELYRTWGVEP